MNEKKRGLTLAGGIVNIVIAALDIILMVFAMTAVADVSSYLGSDVTIYYVPFIIEILFALTILILACVLIANWKKSVVDFNKKSGVVITLFVFECLAVLLGIINIAGGSTATIITTLIYAMCGTFIMVDLVRNKKALKKMNAEGTVQTVAEQPKVAGDHKSRPLTLTGIIVNVVCAAFAIIYDIYAIAVVSSYIALGLFIFLMVLDILFAATILTLSIVMFRYWKLPVQEFGKKGGVVITLFVFNCIAVFFGLISLIAGSASIVYIITTLLYAMCGTFIMVDYARNRKAMKNAPVEATVAEQPAVQMAAMPEVKAEPATAQPQPTVAPAAANSSVENLKQTLKELQEMKEIGLISDADYAKLKENVIKNAKL